MTDYLEGYKKVIDGKRYDTTTAKFCMSNTHYGISDFKWYEERLYKKKTGEYFIAGQGHAMSPWADSYDDGTWGPGCGIKPITESTARKWVEENGDYDDYVKLFGEVAE